MQTIVVLMLVVCGSLFSSSAYAQRPSLRGSKASVDRMARQAKAHDFTVLLTEDRVQDFVQMGLLVRLRSNRNYRVDDEVSHPYVRPQVRTFIERLSSQSRGACADGLTVTSSTRPTREQPRNASRRSVHPTGMAIDLRIPSTIGCVVWLERTLLALEGSRVIEATRERRPPHYHIAVYPRQYAAYIKALSKPSKVTPKRVTKKGSNRAPTATGRRK